MQEDDRDRLLVKALLALVDGKSGRAVADRVPGITQNDITRWRRGRWERLTTGKRHAIQRYVGARVAAAVTGDWDRIGAGLPPEDRFDSAVLRLEQAGLHLAELSVALHDCEWAKYLEAGTGARTQPEEQTPSRPAAELATLLLDTGVLVHLLERLPPGQVLEALYAVAHELKWGAEAINRLDSVAPALLRGAIESPTTGESRAEFAQDALWIERVVDRVAQRLAVIPPERTPGEQRRRPRAARAHRGGA